MDESLNVKVECRSDAGYATRPLAFWQEGIRHEIAAILGQWRLPEGLCFRVLTQDETRFDLFYLEDDDSWQVKWIM